MRYSLPLAASALALAPFALAQPMEDAPRVPALEARLNDERTLFNVSIGQPVSDDLLERGRLVAMGGAEEGGAAMACITCHGARGQGDSSGAFPRLAGLPGWYMYKQLNDYAGGSRPNEVMTGIAQNLTPEEREAVSAYYAAVESPAVPPLGPPDVSEIQWGGQLAAVGSAEKGIPACYNCHGPDGTGDPPSVPYLAGQHASYMVYQLELWKEGVRQNDPMGVMEAIARKMTPEDMRAVSEYFARVRNPDATADAR